MKKKKRNFITKIFSLLLLGIISVTLLGSWTYDPSTDTITSDNLCNPDLTYTDHGNSKGYLVNSYITANTTYIAKNYSSNYGSVILNAYDKVNGNYINGYNQNYDYIVFTLDNNDLITYDWVLFSQNISTGSYLADWNCMINVGSTSLPYEPFGTYVNQKKLDDLELQFDDLAEQYSNLYDEKEQLQQQYDQLEEDFNTLQQNYNTLETNYNNAIDDLDELRDEYQTLQSEYGQLQSDYHALESSIKPFVFDYSKFQINIGNATQSGDNFVATQSVSNIASYFDDFGGFNLDALYNTYSGFGSTYSSIEFIVPNLNLVYFNAMFSFSGMPDMNYRIFLTNSKGQSTQFSYDIKDIVFDNQQTNLNFTLLGGIIHSNSDAINEFVLPLQFTNYSRIILTGLNVGALNVHKISFVSNNSYNIGFQDGYETIKSLTDTTISSLRSSIAQKDDTIRILNKQIVDLNEQIMNSVGWKPLFFAIADTPLKTVSSVLGFELFGVNLFKAFVGIVTALALIWLIKKLLGK